MTLLTSKLAAYLGGAAALALLGWTLVLRADLALTDHTLAGVRRDLQAEQEGRAADRAAASAAAASAAAKAKADTAAIIATQQESLHVAQLAHDRQALDRAAADASHRGLLATATDRAGGQSPDHSAAVGSGLRASGAGGLPLLDVLGWSDETSGELADYADALRISLRACRFEYEAVRSQASGAVSAVGFHPAAAVHAPAESQPPGSP